MASCLSILKKRFVVKSQRKGALVNAAREFFDVKQNKLAQFAGKQSGAWSRIWVFWEAASLVKIPCVFGRALNEVLGGINVSYDLLRFPPVLWAENARP